MREKLIIDSTLTVQDVIDVARYKRKIDFSENYIKRVIEYRKMVNKFSDEERVIYGITTGLGANCDRYISKEERAKFMRNTVLSHSVGVGEPLNTECVRAVMLMMVQQLGSGHSGARLETLEVIRDMLNAGVTPYAPGHGSVGYISVEAHIASVIIGEGKAFFNGELLAGEEALKKAGIKKTVIESKEGLSLVSCITAVNGIIVLALYDAITIAKTADIAGAMSLEVLKGTLKAMDPRLMSVRPHKNQSATASNIRRILADSEIQKKYNDLRVQDALSLRCMPQLHGAAKKLLSDGKNTIDVEINSSLDNPQIFMTSENDGIALMGCNPDGAYSGIVGDTICIAIANLAKMSSCRIDRMVNAHISDLPAFLSDNPGVNNGLMIPQYTAAGLLGEIRLKALPATIDNVPTCAFQEDYVSMGYNAVYKAYECVNLAKYIFAIEIMNACQAQDFFTEEKASSATRIIHDIVREKAKFVDTDRELHSDIEYIAQLIHERRVVEATEKLIGTLDF